MCLALTNQGQCESDTRTACSWDVNAQAGQECSVSLVVIKRLMCRSAGGCALVGDACHVDTAPAKNGCGMLASEADCHDMDTAQGSCVWRQGGDVEGGQTEPSVCEYFITPGKSREHRRHAAKPRHQHRQWHSQELLLQLLRQHHQLRQVEEADRKSVV